MAGPINNDKATAPITEPCNPSGDVIPKRNPKNTNDKSNAILNGAKGSFGKASEMI
jgi:hypothetical protein